MLGTSYSKQKALGIAERRGRDRALVTPPIYVNLGNLNGGLIFNISEDGLALTAALDLAADSILTMQILLPDSEGWIEASGAIAWRGNSKKVGGVRFVGLTEEARRRIGNWIAAEASQWEFQEKEDAGAGFVGVAEETHQGIKNWTAPETPRGEFQVEKETSAQLHDRKENARQRPKDWIFQEASRRENGLTSLANIASVSASNGSILESANPALIVEKQGAIVLANSDTPRDETKKGVAKPNPRRAPVMPGNFRDAGGALGGAERRVQTRTPITPPIYVNLDNTNGGLAFNMSEDGLALTAALALAGGHTMRMRIQIPDSKGWVEVSGRLAWRGESRKTAGITFIGMPEDSRQRIRDWLATETSGRELPPEERTLPKSEQHPSDDVPTETPMALLPEILNANSAVEKRMLEAILSGNGLASVDAPARVPISRQEPQRKLQEETVGLLGSPAEQVEILENSKISNSGVAPSVSAIQEDWLSVPSHLAVRDMRRNKLLATVDTLEAVRQQLLEERKFRPESRPAFHRTISGIRTGKLRRLAALVVLTGVTAAGIGWIAARPGAWNHVATLIAQKTDGTSKSAELEASRLANKTINDPAPRPENRSSQIHESEPMPAHGREGDSETRSAPARSQARDIERSAAMPTVNGPVRRTERLLLKNQAAKIPRRAVVAAPDPVVENARSQAVENLPAQSMQITNTPTTSPLASVPAGTSVADMKGKESLPTPLKQPAAPMAPTWSVAVSTDPYPSLRITPDIGSPKALRGGSLQIGRALSRLEPVYPEDAKREGIEGTVKLHVVVGRDGAVQSVELISGAALLAKAATSAVREWRYAQTVLDGHPVETEQDIVVKFRLASPSISKN